MSRVLLTCEHGGNRIPPRYAPAFRDAGKILESHRGWDAGALLVALEMKRALRAPLIYNEISRLLIDLNRSEGSRALLSPWSKSFELKELVASFHRPHWAKVRKALRGRDCHLAIHSFTPVFKGYRRKTDLGLLFDSENMKERALSERLRGALREEFPGWKIHLNRPYRGSGDGLCTELRKERSRYVGIEIEVNQRHLEKAREIGRKLARAWINLESPSPRNRD